MSEKKAKKLRECNFKCTTCQYYSRDSDFCMEKEIRNCSEHVNTDFAQCESYLINQKLIMY